MASINPSGTEWGWGQDDITLENVTLDKYTFQVPDANFGLPFDTQNNIGLGLNSTFLQALEDAGDVSSFSWSWYFGYNSATPSARKDGQIVFGGYDAAKATGTNVTRPLQTPSDSCPSGIYVHVHDIQLDFTNGTLASILPPLTTFTACVSPDVPLVMTLATDWFERFEAATQTTNIGRSIGINYGGALYSPSNVWVILVTCRSR